MNKPQPRLNIIEESNFGNQSTLDDSLIGGNEQNVAPVQTRLQFIDYYRGLTLAGMLLVNNQGNWSYVIWPLDQSEWNGLTPADCIFPSFLFIMGASIPLSLKYDPSTNKMNWLRVLKRSCLLFLIGVYLKLQHYNFNILNFRLMGVYQRQALCYFAVASIHLLFSRYYSKFVFIAGILLLFCGLQYGYDVPDCGVANLTEECNYGSFVDRKILGQNLMRDFYPCDPEGLFSTLTSIGTTFLGYTFCRIMKKNLKENQKLTDLSQQWLILDSFLLLCGLYLSIWVPINQQLWSISYMFVAGGISGFFFTFFYIIIDILKWAIFEQMFTFCLWLGMNPLAVYTLSIELALLLTVNIKFNGHTPWSWTEKHVFESWMNPYVASTTFSVIMLLLMTLFAYVLYQKKIFIKL